MAKIICVATPLYPPEIGGPATHTALLEQELPSRGFRLRIVKFGGVRGLPKVLRHIVFFFAVLRAARGASCVYALDPVSVGVPALFAARLLRLPLVLRVGGDYAWEQGVQRFGVTQNLDEFVRAEQASFFVRMLQRMQSKVARTAHLVVAPSKYLAGIIETWGVPATRIQVIYSQPDAAFTLISREEARARLNLSQDARIVLSAGRLVPWKGFEGAISAVLAARTKAELFIAGSGPHGAQLQSYIKEKGAQERVTLLGKVAHTDLMLWLCAADAFLLNTRYEGLSHQIIEAFMAGVPVITTPVGGNIELIRDGFEGLLIPPDDTAALAGAIDRVLSDREFAQILVSAAKASLERFSKERAAGALADLFTAI